MPRDLYDLLGVPKSADGEEIRKAYLIRTRVVHPDRFNRAQQAAEWLQANDMLRELNGAYEVLSDPAKRARYDASLGGAQSQPRSRKAEEPTHTGSESSSSAPPEGTSDPKDGAVEGFLQLCHFIWLTCWQQIQAGPSDRTARLLALKAAYADYKRRASPRLSIILEKYRGNTPVVTKARNAAARCLSSLAGGFIGVDDLDRAQTLALEALLLIFGDEKLEAQVKGQIDYVTSEKRKSEPEPRRNNREPLGEGRSGADIGPGVTPGGTPISVNLIICLLVGHRVYWA
jgi:curved DNA-binding protein CbpA